MVDFDKKLKIDRVNQFQHLVKQMAHGTPSEGYTIGEAIRGLPDNLQQFLISEVPDSIIRKEHTRRQLNNVEAATLDGEDAIREAYKEEVFEYNKAEELKNLLGIKAAFPDILDVIEEVCKCFPERYTLDEISNRLYMKEVGML